MLAPLLSLLIAAAVLYAVAWIYGGMRVSGFGSAILAALVYSLFAALLVPATSATALGGLVHFLAAALALWLASWLVPGFQVLGYGSALVSILLIGLIELLLGSAIF